MSAKETWTPYGLEAIRIRYLRRRRFFGILMAISLASVWLLMLQGTTTPTTEIFVNGERAGSGIQIDEPEEKPDRPVTVAIDPGRVTRADTGGAPGAVEPIARVSAPTFTRAPPIPYTAYVFLYGPFILLALAAWFLAKKRGKHDQVNYGIYKGAMPLELVSASMSKHVFTPRWAKHGVFGKRRADYLPEELVLVERVPQEEA